MWRFFKAIRHSNHGQSWKQHYRMGRRSWVVLRMSFTKESVSFSPLRRGRWKGVGPVRPISNCFSLNPWSCAPNTFYSSISDVMFHLLIDHQLYFLGNGDIDIGNYSFTHLFLSSLNYGRSYSPNYQINIVTVSSCLSVSWALQDRGDIFASCIEPLNKCKLSLMRWGDFSVWGNPEMSIANKWKKCSDFFCISWAKKTNTIIQFN